MPPKSTKKASTTAKSPKSPKSSKYATKKSKAVTTPVKPVVDQSKSEEESLDEKLKEDEDEDTELPTIGGAKRKNTSNKPTSSKKKVMFEKPGNANTEQYKPMLGNYVLKYGEIHMTCMCGMPIHVDGPEGAKDFDGKILPPGQREDPRATIAHDDEELKKALKDELRKLPINWKYIPKDDSEAKGSKPISKPRVSERPSHPTRGSKRQKGMKPEYGLLK